MTLAGQHICITGAGAGIGLGIARECRKAGASVTAMDISTEGAKKIEAIGATFMELDVADADAFADALQIARDRHGTLTGLVNNAGIISPVDFLDMTLAHMERYWQINQRSVMVGCQAAARIMVKAEQGGSIINIASNHARAGDPGFEGYAGSKGAIVAMTRAMAWSLGPHGIRVNALCPGLTRTEIVIDAMNDPDNERSFRSWAADNQVSSVEDIGQVAVFLLSDASTAINGSEVLADRGMTALLGAGSKKLL